jgi:DNA-binding transcriptional ArsR family regulator
MARGVKQKTERPKIESTLGALVSHPTRVKAYVILTERVASPKQIADEIGEDVTHVGYHVRKLEELKLIELVDEQQVRGAVKHFYRATKRPYLGPDAIEEMSVEDREALTLYTLQLAMADFSRALDAGTFDSRPNRWLVRVPLQLDETGFAEMSELHEAFYRDTLEIQSNSAARLAENGGDGAIPTVSTATFFEVPGKAA